jgi:hypothetical protein
VPTPGRFERVIHGRPIGYSTGANGGDSVTEAGSAAFREQPLASGCRCGCGEQVGRGARYRPGHDARHASQVGRAMIAAGAEDPELLAALPSEALRAKPAPGLRPPAYPRPDVTPSEGLTPGPLPPSGRGGQVAARAAVDRQPVLFLSDVGQPPPSVQHQPCWNASHMAEPAVAPTSAKATVTALEG